MSWFADLAGKAESLLNNIDEQTGVVLRNQSNIKVKKHEPLKNSESVWAQNRALNQKKGLSKMETNPRQTKIIIGQTIKSLTPRNQQSQNQSNETQINTKVQNKFAPNRKRINLNRCVKTNETKDNGLRKRRNSLPADLEVVKNKDLVYEMQSLEVENAMLKNEINVMNREMSELHERLRKAEDDLVNTQSELGNSEKLNYLIKSTKDSLDIELEEIKLKLEQKSLLEIEKHKERSQELETEVNLLSNMNKHMMERVNFLEEDIESKDSRISKLEKDLRQAQTKIVDVESTLDKTTADSENLMKEWEAYKLRVKNMLFAKDNEIKLLRDGSNLTEDTKLLMEQIETLKEEKEELSASLSRAKEEQNESHTYTTQVEEMRASADRLGTALMDALKEERAARNNAEDQCDKLAKELESLQMHTAETIENLTLSLHKTEEELNALRESTSTVATADPSALNVADYDVIQSDKIQCLTQTLIQRQSKIDTLLADNNILRIQLGKLESKYKTEMSSGVRNSHSVVTLQDGDVRRARVHGTSPLAALSVKMGVIVKRYPIFRTFIMCYMIGLHLWVMTVLFTSTPQDYVPKPARL